MKKEISSSYMMMSLVMGYAVIINLVATSRYEFYPVNFVIGAAFAVGIAMVIGSLVFFMAEPKPLGLKFGRFLPSGSQTWKPLAGISGRLHTARKVPVAAGSGAPPSSHQPAERRPTPAPPTDWAQYRPLPAPPKGFMRKRRVGVPA